MEIIGISSTGYKSEFIIKISKDDLEELTDTYYGKHEPFSVGSRFNISPIYNQARFIKDHPGQIKMAKANLQKIIDNLTLLSPFTVPEEDIIEDQTEEKAE